MIACLADGELSFGTYTVPVLRREAEPSLRRMAEHVFSTAENGADAESIKRAEAVKRLQQLWRELSRPLGGKPWTTRDELYDE